MHMCACERVIAQLHLQLVHMHACTCACMEVTQSIASVTCGHRHGLQSLKHLAVGKFCAADQNYVLQIKTLRGSRDTLY